MSTANIYGSIVSAKKVEEAMKAHLELWLDDYLGEQERIDGYAPNSIERPRGIVTASEFAKWPEDQVPVVLCLAAGMAHPPVRRGDGSYEARWLIGVAPVVSDVDQVATRDLASTYAAAVRAAVVQHKSLGHFASYTIWRDETYGDMPFDKSRSLGAARVVFEVGVDNVVTESGGPPAPTGDPSTDPGPWPLAQIPTLEVDLEPITEDVTA